MWNWLVDRIIAIAKRTPYVHLPGYMFRWWLIPYNRWIPSLRVHEIIASDDDRAFHDHPWWYVTVILRGGYWEIRPLFHSGIYICNSRTWRGPGSVLFRQAASWHRLEVPDGSVATTLFMTGRYKRRWGFLIQPRHKLYHKDYVLEYGPPEWRKAGAL